MSLCHAIENPDSDELLINLCYPQHNIMKGWRERREIRVYAGEDKDYKQSRVSKGIR